MESETGEFDISLKKFTTREEKDSVKLVDDGVEETNATGNLEQGPGPGSSEEAHRFVNGKLQVACLSQ